VRGALLVVVVVATSACGGSSTGSGLAPTLDVSAFVRATGDPAAIERMLSGSVVNGGLWFDDQTCATQFAAPEEIKPDRFGSFARCLAGLHLQASPRVDELADAVVLTYAPGFEIEARVINEPSGPRITWIGYESRLPTEPLVPTITAAALESHRLTGDRTGPLAPEVAKALELTPSPSGDVARTWLKICVDPEGAVTIQPRETTSLSAQNAFAHAATAWTFRPFVVRDHAIAVCAMVQLAYPTDRAGPVETLPLPLPRSASKRTPVAFSQSKRTSQLLEARRIGGPKNIFPDDATKVAIQESGVTRVAGTFRICIDETGHVESILPTRLTGFPAYDRTLIAGMQTWRYSPFLVDGQPTPVCTKVTFIYSQY
jgi:hypothetical protein